MKMSLKTTDPLIENNSVFLIKNLDNIIHRVNLSFFKI